MGTAFKGLCTCYLEHIRPVAELGKEVGRMHVSDDFKADLFYLRGVKD